MIMCLVVVSLAGCILSKNYLCELGASELGRGDLLRPNFVCSLRYFYEK